MSRKSPLTPLTEEQKQQYFEVVRYAADMALNQVQIDYDQFMRVIESLDELGAMITLRILELATSDLYSKNEGSANPIYQFKCPDNFKTRPIVQQIDILRQLFPNELNCSAEESLAIKDDSVPGSGYGPPAPVPNGAEGWCAIPRWERFAPTYGEAVQKVLDKIAAQRLFKNLRGKDGRLGLSRLCRREHALKAFNAIGHEQKDHGILVFPAQFGLRYSRYSVRRARESLNVTEFELGAFEVGIMLLTHPERFQSSNDLGIICSGDEFAPGAYGNLSLVPSYRLNLAGEVEFNAHWCDYHNPCCGVATGFLPPR